MTKTQPLVFHATDRVPEDIINQKVADLVDDNFKCKWMSFSHFFTS